MSSVRALPVLASSCLTIALWLSATGAAAQPAPTDAAKEQARALYGEATQAAQKGRVADAARLFEQAATLAPHAASHMAAGRTFLAARDDVAAADHLARALALGVPEGDRADVEKTLATLQKKLGRVAVRGDRGTARLDDGRTLPLPATLHGAPGPHRVQFSVDAGEGSADVELRAGEEASVEATVAPKEAPRTESTTPTEPAPTNADASTGPDPLWIGGLAGLGLAVVGGGVTIGLGLAANGAKEDFLVSRTQSDFDGASGLETGTNVALVGSIACAAIGGALVGIALMVDDEAPVEAGRGGMTWRF